MDKARPKSSFDLEAYLNRVGFAGATRPELGTLKAIQLAHAQSIPFENLDPLRDHPVNIERESLRSKILMGRRGGYCFEQNRLLLDALQTLGFQARGLGASVVYKRPEGTKTARTHMLVEILLDQQKWLADVGFGGASLSTPLLFEELKPQKTLDLTYRIKKIYEGYCLELEYSGGYSPMYEFDLRTYHEADYELGNWYTSTHPDSHFRHRLNVAKLISDGRATLNGNTLKIKRIDQATETRVLESSAEIIEVLDTVFGMTVPNDPKLMRAFEREIATEENS